MNKKLFLFMTGLLVSAADITNAAPGVPIGALVCTNKCESSNIPSEANIRLLWYKNPPEENVIGYKIYISINDGSYYSDFITPDTRFPDWSLKLQQDLILPDNTLGGWFKYSSVKGVKDSFTCFKLIAYNLIGESPLSDPLCLFVAK